MYIGRNFYVLLMFVSSAVHVSAWNAAAISVYTCPMFNFYCNNYHDPLHDLAMC